MASRQNADNSGHASVKTALRVIEIIEIYAQEGRSLTLTELSKLLDAPMSSCLGLIRTLVSRGYLYETGRRQGYYPTARLLHIAQRIARNDPVLERMQPVMEFLRGATGETVVFGQLQDSRVRYLDVLESANPVRYIATPGELRDPRVNSIGRAILGASSDEARGQILDGLPFVSVSASVSAADSVSAPAAASVLAPAAPAAIASRETLESRLRQWREQGWYPNLGESFADLGAIAIPVVIGEVIYGLSVAGPIHRVQTRVPEIVAALQACRVTPPAWRSPADSN